MLWSNLKLKERFLRTCNILLCLCWPYCSFMNNREHFPMQHNSSAQFHPKILLRAMFKLANYLRFRCLLIKKKSTALNDEAFLLPITHTEQDTAQMRVNWHHAVSCLLSPAPIIAAWLPFSQPEGPPAGKLSSTACTTRDQLPPHCHKANLAWPRQQRILLMKYIYDLPQTCIVPH